MFGYEPKGRGFESLQPYQLVTSDMSLVTSFFISLQSSSRAHSAAPRFQTEPTSLGFGLGPPLRGGFFLSQKILILTVSFKIKGHLLCRCPFIWVPQPKGRLHPSGFPCSGRQSRPCASGFHLRRKPLARRTRAAAQKGCLAVLLQQSHPSKISTLTAPSSSSQA